MLPAPQRLDFRRSVAKSNSERCTVRVLTALFRNSIAKRPPCEAKWQAALQVSIDFNMIWARLCRPFLTPRDFKNYYRFLHRSMLTRNVRAQICPLAQDVPVGTDNEACRMCLLERETFSHIYKCWEVEQIFERFASLAGQLGITLANTERMRVLGLTSQESVLPGTLSDFHIIAWKFIILSMVKVETEQVKFDRTQVWSDAIRRQDGRLAAHAERARRSKVTRGGLSAQEVQRLTAEVTPLAEYDESCNLIRARAWADELDRMRMYKAVNQRRPRREARYGRQGRGRVTQRPPLK